MKQLFLGAAILLSVLSYGQKIEIGGGIGGMNYKGDISPTFDYRFYRPAANLFFRYNTGKAVSFRAEVLGGSIGASDAKSKDPFQRARNASFKTRIGEINALMEYNFRKYNFRKGYSNWTPYLFGGLGYYFSSPSPRTGNYKTSGLCIPFGAGVKWEISRPWSLGVEFGTRQPFSDYLDNIGGDSPLRQRLQQSDPAQSDLYYYTSVTLSYTFFKLFCPVQ